MTCRTCLFLSRLLKIGKRHRAPRLHASLWGEFPYGLVVIRHPSDVDGVSADIQPEARKRGLPNVGEVLREVEP